MTLVGVGGDSLLLEREVLVGHRRRGTFIIDHRFSSASALDCGWDAEQDITRILDVQRGTMLAGLVKSLKIRRLWELSQMSIAARGTEVFSRLTGLGARAAAPAARERGRGCQRQCAAG